MCELTRRMGMKKRHLLRFLFDENRTKMSSYGSYNYRNTLSGESPALDEIRV